MRRPTRWPWVAQVGADGGGFYRHQSLENLAGRGLRNVETVHPERAHEVGGTLLFHPKASDLPVVEVVTGAFLLAHAAPVTPAEATGGR